MVSILFKLVVRLLSRYGVVWLWLGILLCLCVFLQGNGLFNCLCLFVCLFSCLFVHFKAALERRSNNTERILLLFLRVFYCVHKRSTTKVELGGTWGDRPVRQDVSVSLTGRHASGIQRGCLYSTRGQCDA